MVLVPRFLAAALLLGAAAGCSTVLDNYTYTSSVETSMQNVQQSHARVYLIRGLIGEVFSRGLDTLAEKIRLQGISASVHSMYSTGALAEEVIANYRRDPGPIILIGHSSGGDVAIDIAKRLREASIPVGIIFGFDPTPIAGNVPDNVELFINLFQKSNPIGGGVVKSGGGFHGRLINVDLREHSEIIHITLDKSDRIHNAVVSEIVSFLSSAQPPPQGFIRPYFLAYVVPPNEPIEIWDSGVQVVVRPGENLRTLSANYQVPVWLLAQVNRLSPEAAPAPGTSLIVPQHMYQRAEPGLTSYAR
jgi:LysM repeat protein